MKRSNKLLVMDRLFLCNYFGYSLDCPRRRSFSVDSGRFLDFAESFLKTVVQKELQPKVEGVTADNPALQLILRDLFKHLEPGKEYESLGGEGRYEAACRYLANVVTIALPIVIAFHSTSVDDEAGRRKAWEQIGILKEEYVYWQTSLKLKNDERMFLDTQVISYFFGRYYREFDRKSFYKNIRLLTISEVRSLPATNPKSDDMTVCFLGHECKITRLARCLSFDDQLLFLAIMRVRPWMYNLIHFRETRPKPANMQFFLIHGDPRKFFEDKLQEERLKYIRKLSKRVLIFVFGTHGIGTKLLKQLDFRNLEDLKQLDKREEWVWTRDYLEYLRQNKEGPKP